MKTYIKYLLLVIFLAIVVYVLKFSPLSYYFFTAEGKEIFASKFGVYLQKIGPWGPFLFIGFFAFSVLFFLPASIFSSLGGILFGSWLGLALNIAGAMIGGVMSFFMARYLLRDAAGKFLQKGHFKKLDDKAGEHGLSIMIYMRLMFVPFTYLSFASGLSKIKFRDFFWGTFIGVIPGLIVVTFLASAAKELILTYKQPADVLKPEIILPLVLFGFSFFIPSIIKHFKKKFYMTKEIEKEVGEQ